MIGKKIIIMALALAIILPFAKSAALSEISYSVKISFEKEYAYLESAKLVYGTAAEEDKTEKYDYRLKLVSFRGELLDSREFNLPGYWDDIDVAVKNGNFIMFLPYYTNAQQIEIYSGERKISKLDVSEFASCNQDKFCSIDENFKECPDDCAAKEAEIIAVEIPEKAIIQQKLAALQKEPINYTLIIAAIILALITLLYALSKRSKVKKS